MCPGGPNQQTLSGNVVDKRIRLVSIIILCTLASCTARPTLEELEAEALVTGDWSAVEHRKLMHKRMKLVEGTPPCDGGYVLLCKTKSAQEVCTCVSPLNRNALRH